MSADINSSSVLPPADALPGDTPVSEGHAAVTAHEFHVGPAAGVVGTACGRGGDSPQGSTAVKVLLVLFEDLNGFDMDGEGEGKGRGKITCISPYENPQQPITDLHYCL